MTPAAATKVYGAADPVLTGTLAGFLAGDTVTATYSRTAGESVAASPYTISAVLEPGRRAGQLPDHLQHGGVHHHGEGRDRGRPNAASKVYGAADPAFTRQR